VYSVYPGLELPTQIRIAVLNDRNASVAQITVYPPNSDPVVATGSSKRAHGDTYSRAVGETLAVGRALRNVSREVLKHADKLSDTINPEPDAGRLRRILTKIRNGDVI
jgi:hypothetical protein